MALTMTRTRTQTTLTKLATMLANVHGELAFVESWLSEGDGVPPMLEARRQKLLADRDALYATIKQFDSSIDPRRVVSAAGWQLAYGKGRPLREKTLRARYLQYGEMR